MTAVLWLRVPPDRLDTTARSIAMLPEARMCRATSGSANLLVVVWLAEQQQLVALESGLVTKLPWLEIVDRAIALRNVKLMGHLLDEDGRSTGHVPLDLWGTAVRRPCES